MQQGSGGGWAIGVVSLRSCQKLPPCLTEPVPAGSKQDSPLAKAKTISDGGSATGIRRKKNCCTDAIEAREEQSENM